VWPRASIAAIKTVSYEDDPTECKRIVAALIGKAGVLKEWDSLVQIMQDWPVPLENNKLLDPEKYSKHPRAAGELLLYFDLPDGLWKDALENRLMKSIGRNDLLKMPSTGAFDPMELQEFAVAWTDHQPTNDRIKTLAEIWLHWPKEYIGPVLEKRLCASSVVSALRIIVASSDDSRRLRSFEERYYSQLKYAAEESSCYQNLQQSPVVDELSRLFSIVTDWERLMDVLERCRRVGLSDAVHFALATIKTSVLCQGADLIGKQIAKRMKWLDWSD